MSDEETLEELREMYTNAEYDANVSQECVNEVTRSHERRLDTLNKARKRYLAHLEMMAAGVKQ